MGGSSRNSTIGQYERIQRIGEFLLERTSHRPILGIICGSGLGGLADELDEKQTFLYETIPDFPVSTVPGHNGCLIFGTLSGVATVCMKGRFHTYEGYSPSQCAMPIRVMKLLGVRTLIVTNAAGGLNENFNVGDIMILRDHISLPSLSGDNPLTGQNDSRWGVRFPPLSNAYDRVLCKLMKESACEMNKASIIKEGVYCMVGGPCYETVAEARLIRALGGDAVGMSTVNEVICATHCGMKVLACSLITNKCITNWETEEEANHDEVLGIGQKRAKDLVALLKRVIFKAKEKLILFN